MRLLQRFGLGLVCLLAVGYVVGLALMPVDKAAVAGAVTSTTVASRTSTTTTLDSTLTTPGSTSTTLLGDARCWLLVRLVAAAVSLGSLELDLDYQGMSGEFPGSADQVQCDLLLAESGYWFFDSDSTGKRVLSLDFTTMSSSGIVAPVDLAHCLVAPSNPLALPTADQISLSIVDALKLDGSQAKQLTVSMTLDCETAASTGRATGSGSASTTSTVTSEPGPSGSTTTTTGSGAVGTTSTSVTLPTFSPVSTSTTTVQPVSSPVTSSTTPAGPGLGTGVTTSTTLAKLPFVSTSTTFSAPGTTVTTTTVTDGNGSPSGLCGDADDNGTITATDALIALRTAVGLDSCPVEICDVNSSTSVTATDALDILRAAVGLPGALDCPPPSG